MIAAILLVVVVWQMSRLGAEHGLDRGALARERLGMVEADRLFAVTDQIDHYRRSIVLGLPSANPERAQIDAAIANLKGEFHTSELGIGAKFDAFEAAWKKVRTVPAGPRAYVRVFPVFRTINDLYSAIQDGSGLTYDTSATAQNLALNYIYETPYAASAAERLRTLLDLADQQHSMTLEQRMYVGNAINGVRGGTDVSDDDLPILVRNLSTILPKRHAEWARLPVYAQQLIDSGSKFADWASKNVMLTYTPNVPAAQIDAYALAVRKAALRMHSASGSALEANLAYRGHVQELRNRYFYLAFVIGAVLIVGVMLTLAQLVARRDRMALREAQQESARYQAELARQEAEEALRLSEAQFRAVFDGAAVGIAVVDRTGLLVDANSVFRTMFGETIGAAIDGHEVELAALLAGERETFEFEQSSRSPSGQEIFTDATISVVNDDEHGPLFAICMFRDKTALKHSERRMQHDKMHDALTGLPNRQLFEQALRNRFDEAGALLDSFFAVLFVDLEHFKDVNESMGHAAGDLVLTQIAGRLRSSVDARDVVARVGSDEFAVLVQSLGDILHVESVARRILNNLSKAVTIGSKSIYLGASVGIAIGSSSYERAEDVMRDAEIAMQHAKNTGGTRYALFDSKMHARAQKRLQLVSDLRLAIERNEFRLLYQPIVNLADGSPMGCEALIRWDHPAEGVVMPNEFIPLAEQTGLASAIGRFVLETAAAQLAAWRRNRGGTIDFSMHVNISASELNDPEFERVLVQLVEHHGLRPEDLTLEITESLVLDSGTRANVTLERVRDRGFQICIDDFGTGYSSMRYLQQFKVDAIKIDRSFVSGGDGDLASEPIVRTLMTLAEAFDVRVVSEGVETARQREMLRNAGCRYAQGYLYARPLSAGEMVSMYPEVLGRAPRSASA
ncbi:MAG TPA: EAL domain-containing protein [Candidatus Aquilonibacter sp.]|nr:EAL domain-containing protein [Candidatus Aquilonibacter sp.]